MQNTLHNQDFQSQKSLSWQLPEMKKKPQTQTCRGSCRWKIKLQMEISFSIYYGSDAVQVWGPCFSFTDKKTEGTRQIVSSSGIFCMSSVQALHKQRVLQHAVCTGQVARNLVLFMKLQGSHLGFRQIILHSFQNQVYKAHVQKCFLFAFLFALMKRKAADNITYNIQRNRVPLQILCI